MFLNSWSIALVLCWLVVIFLMGYAVRSAVRVLLHWDPGSDSNRQIRLENEIWLTSTLVEYAFGVQIVSLLLFVLAADYFSQSIVGAMCATGSLLANAFGIPALAIKIAGVFLYGFWIVLHQLDIRSEKYPLVRLKYVYLLLLAPLLILDLILGFLYIAGLEPDIITSCCAVVFGESAGGGTNLLTGFGHGFDLAIFYAFVGVLLLAGGGLLFSARTWLVVLFSTAWLLFFPVSLLVITSEFSSYVYAMPFHNCPFCLLKPEYGYIGFAIYGTLFAGALLGMSVLVTHPLRSREDLAGLVSGYRKKAVTASLVLLVLFTSITSYHYLRYLIIGGEG